MKQTYTMEQIDETFDTLLETYYNVGDEDMYMERARVVSYALKLLKGSTKLMAALDNIKDDTMFCVVK